MQKGSEDNLKTLLLKLSSSIQEALKDSSKLEPRTVAKLTTISSFMQEALKSIETQQMLNAVLQDSDNGLFLQIPLAHDEGCSLADIFITPEERDKRGRKNFSSCSVAIFLHLDILGEITINAGLHRDNFNCVIKCSTSEASDIINDKLNDLKTALLCTGYRVDYINCFQEEGLADQREEFIANRFMPAEDLINYFV